MKKNKIYSKSYRVRKAYSTAFKVIWSYARLYFLKKIFGKKYYQRRILKLHLKNAERVKKAILQLQGLFIKIGQLLSILTNFLPEAFQEPLESLQDQIPPRPFSEIQKRIISEFGKDTTELFAHFEELPIAAASIGQAHRATLHTGEDVVVKVQHNNIEEIAKVDLEVIRRLVNLVAWFFDIKGLDHAYTQVRKMIEEELNFSKEARAMEIVRQNLIEEQSFAIPKVYKDYSTTRILTTSFFDGVKISNVKQLDAWGVDKTDLANRLVRLYSQMVFSDGFYHADPHPGNILVQSNGTIVLLDFGAIGELRPEIRVGFLELINAAIKNDTDKIIEVLKSLGFLADGREAERIAEKVIAALRNFLQNEVQFEGLNFKEITVNPFETSIFNLISEIGLLSIANTVQVPKEWVLLNRMVTLLLGICNTLDNNMNPLEVVKPYFQEFLLGEKGNFVKFVTDLLQNSLTSALSLPGEVHKTLKKVQKGELEVQITGSIEKTKLFYLMGQQFIFLVLMLASLTFGYLFLQNGNLQFSNISFGSAGFFLILLFMAFRKGRKIKKTLDLL